jgi:hypothetical protein
MRSRACLIATLRYTEFRAFFATIQSWGTNILNIEERLEKLTERHEALTQTVELMAAENQQRDRRMGEIMEAIARLLHIAELHEQRIERLEG